MKQSLLEEKLSAWIGAGLLTDEQAQRILLFESSHVESRENRMVKGLAVLAALSIGLGIISMIAANWDMIGPGLKLSAYFGLLSLSIFSLFRLDRFPNFVAEALPLIHFLLILAGIGLIAQIYHLPSDGWRGLALWSALGFLPMAVLEKPKLTVLWLFAYLSARLAWVAHKPADMGLRLDLFFLQWIVLALAVESPLKLPKTLKPWIQLLLFALVFLLYPYFLGRGYGEEKTHLIWPLVLLGSWLWVFRIQKALSPTQRTLALIALLAFSLRAYLLYSFASKFPNHWANFVEAIAFLVEATVLSIFALRFEQERWFQQLSLLMVLRVAFLFLTLFGTLLVSGGGLIVLGIMLLLLLRSWFRYRSQIQNWLKEMGR